MSSAVMASTSVVNPLANPKGKKLVCELCKKPARLLCEACRVTYYCCEEHKVMDARGIHERICTVVKFLKTKTTFFPSEEERKVFHETVQKRKLEILNVSRTIGQKYLFEGKYQEAIPAAMQALKAAIEVHGIASVEVVPAYLILGEASIGLGNLNQAEEYLTQAEWTTMKTFCPRSIKYKLFRIMGLLHVTKQQHTEALQMFSDDVYHASEEYSPDDIRTSGGYFHMASVFLQQGKMDIADSLVRKVTSIWFNYLLKLTNARLEDTRSFTDLPRRIDPPSLSEEGLDEAQQAEALKVLSSIIEARRSIMRDDGQMLDALFSLAMLHFVILEFDKATTLCQEGLSFASSIEGYEASVIANMRRLFKELSTNPTFLSEPVKTIVSGINQTR